MKMMIRMEIECTKYCVALILMRSILICSAAQVTAMFAFGDSLTDPGNNNYLNSLAKANYMPYGVDFYGGLPSGRFCNGKTFVDYLGELLGLPVLLPYTSPFATGRNVVRGVNYASAAGGILEETGRHLGERFSLSAQVVNFESTLSEVRSQMGDEEFSNYLAKALVVMSLGSNDYINNYMLPSFYASSYIYTPNGYADLLISRYTRQILALRSLGLRKFLLGGIGPLGCIPNQVAAGAAPPGKCVAYANNVAAIFNQRLQSLVDDLNAKYNGTIFSYGNTFGAFVDLLNNANTYGFNVTDRGCCGIGRKQGQITCLPFSVPCNNRKQHIFWDAFHPTEAVNQILAERAYSGSPSDCHPLNVQQMTLM
ncbi:GDSL esterase/lipase At5g08460-like [Salvia miltiorrhiza]|uniref:GDSL esterase/lipase At5g08460-like n=1 Tax=Salvia miltiorrhiza TaxID=226208 RepID=UPI0025ACA874|nr:GDSL esterase/lipase At5g08460-like [Salvia miltiorrhiza]